MSTIEELGKRHFAASRKYVRSMPTHGFKLPMVINLRHLSNNKKYCPQGRSGKVLYRLLGMKSTPDCKECLIYPMKWKAKGITVLPWEITEQ